MPYKVIVTMEFTVDERHPLLAAKHVSDKKDTIPVKREVYVFGEDGSLAFRDHDSMKPYPDHLGAHENETLDEIMAGWHKDSPFI